MMIVVPNPTLLDNHQEELAAALEEMGHLRTATVECVFYHGAPRWADPMNCREQDFGKSY